MQVQSMNLNLNMKDINKILAKAHFKCNFFFNDAKKQHILVETCLYKAVGNLRHAFTSPSCSPWFLQVWWALQINLFLQIMFVYCVYSAMAKTKQSKIHVTSKFYWKEQKWASCLAFSIMSSFPSILFFKCCHWLF
jgi:hypothetical protein